MNLNGSYGTSKFSVFVTLLLLLLLLCKNRVSALNLTFGFVIALFHYSTGIVSTIMANLNQNKMDATKRQKLLRQALWMLERADLILKERREPTPCGDENPSKDWSLVKLSLLNNQACVLKDLCVDDQVIVQRLLDMGLTLSTSLPILDTPDQQSFLWTINYLVQDVYALAA